MKLRPDAFDWRLVDGEIIVLDLRTSTYLAVNQSGAALWADLVKGASRHELAAQLAGRFDLSEPKATEDVDGFLSMLREHGLLDDETGDNSPR